MSITEAIDQAAIDTIRTLSIDAITSVNCSSSGKNLVEVIKR